MLAVIDVLGADAFSFFGRDFGFSTGFFSAFFVSTGFTGFSSASTGRFSGKGTTTSGLIASTG
ncbi:hypothetical protein, partial [Mesorhizobium sp.]|uniref:hypothetical protein n=1 Tax=Mesorhizobium sp. TaxID=1871066 RepID=UPI0025BDC05B